MFYVYALKSKRDNSLYIGYTADLRMRLKSHFLGRVFSTRKKRPLKLVYYEAYKEEKDARRREYELKHNSSQKENLKRRLRFSLR